MYMSKFRRKASPFGVKVKETRESNHLGAHGTFLTEIEPELLTQRPQQLASRKAGTGARFMGFLLVYHCKTTSLVTWLVNPSGLVSISKLVTRQVTHVTSRVARLVTRS